MPADAALGLFMLLMLIGVIFIGFPISFTLLFLALLVLLLVAWFGVERVPATPVETVVDTTGAGDLYASGFLWGLTRGFGLARCGRIASIAAAEVISHYGARPLADLRELVA